MTDWNRELGWKEDPRPVLMKWRDVLVAWWIPVGVQALILAMLFSMDPCRGNPGCMAGSISGYAMLLINAPSLVLLGIFALLEKMTRKFRLATALKTNLALALLPYLAGALLIYLPTLLDR